MKILISMVGFVLISSSIGVAAEPSIPEGVIAEAYNSYGKFVTSGVRVMKNGEVFEFIGPYQELIAKLSKPKVTALQKTIDTLTATPLKRNDPDAKPCASDDLKLYRVVHSDKKIVTLVKVEGCIKYRMEDHLDRELKHVIQGLEALAELAH